MTHDWVTQALATPVGDDRLEHWSVSLIPMESSG